MGKLSSFTFITLNGYFAGTNGDISWHKQVVEEEENKFAADSMRAGGILLFGRKTYEIMAQYWPSQTAAKINPSVAKGMNKAEKIVFSNTLKNAEWNNTRIIAQNITGEIKKLKEYSPNDMVILGSGSILKQFAEAGLVEEFQVMVDPVLIGNGETLFKDIACNIQLELTGSKVFKSGIVLLIYKYQKLR